jgi:hypothetical protein
LRMAFNVDLLGNVCLASFLLAGKKRLHIVKAVHHLFKLCLHSLSPVSLKNTIGTFPQGIAF